MDAGEASFAFFLDVVVFFSVCSGMEAPLYAKPVALLACSPAAKMISYFISPSLIARNSDVDDIVSSYSESICN